MRKILTLVVLSVIGLSLIFTGCDSKETQSNISKNAVKIEKLNLTSKEARNLI